MIRVLLIALITALLPTAGWAYDFLYSGESMEPMEEGLFRAELELLYLAADDAFDSDGASRRFGPDWAATWIPVKISYAFRDWLAVGANVRYGLLSLEDVAISPEGGDADGATSDFEGSGLDDVWVWGRLRMLEKPVVSARAAVKIPVGTEPADIVHSVADTGFFLDEEGHLAVGDGQTDIDAAVLVAFPRETGTFEVSIGYRHRTKLTVEREEGSYDFTPGGEIRFTAGYVYHLNSAMDLRLGLDGFSASDDSVDGACECPGHSHEDTDEQLSGSARSGVWINPSFEYVMDSGLVLGFDMHYPLMGQNIAAEWGVGFHVGLMR
jgi:hypothetical protein